MKTKEFSILKSTKMFTDESDVNIMNILHISPDTADFVEIPNSDSALKYQPRSCVSEYTESQVRWSESALINLLPKSIRLSKDSSANEYNIEIGYHENKHKHYIKYSSRVHAEEFLGDNNIDCCISAFVYLATIDQIPISIRRLPDTEVFLEIQKTPSIQRNAIWLDNTVDLTKDISTEIYPKWGYAAANNIIKYFMKHGLITKKYVDEHYNLKFDIINEIRDGIESTKKKK